MSKSRQLTTSDDSHDYTQLPPECDVDLESTPLLVQSGQNERKPTPLPVAQLLILAAVRLAEPIALTQIFPYVNQMIEELGIAEQEDLGYYSGIVDSMFSVAQLLTIYHWSSLSDRIGRKPVLLMGLTGCAIASMSFGLSRSLGGMLIARALAGGLSGNVAVVSSILSEITDETNQGKAFPLIGATWNIGTIIGPMIGGGLIKPAERWPGVFGGIQFFKDYPYALPCIVSALMTFLAIIACWLFVDETHPRIVKEKTEARRRALEALQSPTRPSYKRARSTSYGATWKDIIDESNRAHTRRLNGHASDDEDEDDSAASTPTLVSPSEERGLKTPMNESIFVASSSNPCADDSEEEQEPEQQPKSVAWFLLSQPHIRAVLFSGFMLSFLGVGYDVLLVLYSYTRVDLGGMGRGPEQIATALSSAGLVGTIMSLLVFPFIQTRFNNRKLYIFFTSCWAIVFALLPLGNIAARIVDGDDVTTKTRDAVLWGMVASLLGLSRVAGICYPLNMLIVKGSVDDPNKLGSMFGLQQSFSSIARAIAPTFVSALFAFNIDTQLLHGNFVWVVMILSALLATLIAANVRPPKSAQPSRSESHSRAASRAQSPRPSRSASASMSRSQSQSRTGPVEEPVKGKRTRAVSSLSPTR